ncbi:MAG TPA: hypothetical protein VF702_00475 [Allosphingosinicella sp.]|jgi:hypothetical protein
MDWDEDGDEEQEGGSAGGRGTERSIRSLRLREDGFTPARQKIFLKALRRTGCVADAARKAGISKNSVDRARRKFADFDARCKAARALALPGLEEIAYQRATVGAPAKVIRNGKLVEVRVQPSDAMLRLLLAGAAPKKYGRYAGLKRAEDGARGREKWRRPRSPEEVRDSILRKLAAIRRHRLESGDYAEGPDGQLLPKGMRLVGVEELKRLGWRPPEEEAPPPAPGEGEAGEA